VVLSKVNYLTAFEGKKAPGTCEELCFEKGQRGDDGRTLGQIPCIVSFRWTMLPVIAFSFADFFILLPPISSLRSLVSLPSACLS
jgi:hypothetical protein